MVEYIQQPRAIQQQSVAIKNRDLKAMGTVVSERVITIDELASCDRYAEGETVQVQAQREIVVQQPQVVEYIQSAPMVEYVQEQVVEYIQPQMIQAAPQLSYTQRPQTVTMAPQSMTTMARPQMMGLGSQARQQVTMAPQMMGLGSQSMMMGSIV